MRVEGLMEALVGTENIWLAARGAVVIALLSIVVELDK